MGGASSPTVPALVSKLCDFGPKKVLKLDRKAGPEPVWRVLVTHLKGDREDRESGQRRANFDLK